MSSTFMKIKKKKKCGRDIVCALGVKKMLSQEARGTNPWENRLSLCHIVCNCFSFLPLQQPVTSDATNSPILRKAKAITPV